MNTKVASAEVIDQSKRGYGYVPILLVELTASVPDVRDPGTAGYLAYDYGRKTIHKQQPHMIGFYPCLYTE